jgi:hypothetical protein
MMETETSIKQHFYKSFIFQDTIITYERYYEPSRFIRSGTVTWLAERLKAS